jgi:deazaflavin-dependent oxidoreductase (nitroreductase family)
MRAIGPKPPGPFVRRLFRFPIWLGRLRLGWLVGNNVLLITTTGRRSGARRVAAVRCTFDPATGTYFVVSGWGGRTGRYRNVRADPRVTVRARARTFDAVVEPLQAAVSVRLIEGYARRNPFGTRLTRLEAGVWPDGSEASRRVIAAHYPAVALRAIG